jgi:hypothetical protein
MRIPYKSYGNKYYFQSFYGLIYTVPRIFSFFLLLRPSERGFPRLPNSHARKFFRCARKQRRARRCKNIVCTVNTRQSSSCLRRCFPAVLSALVLLLGVLYFSVGGSFVLSSACFVFLYFNWGCFSSQRGVLQFSVGGALHF